jgi:hypothetical protein
LDVGRRSCKVWGGFEVIDFGGGNVDEAGLIAINVETGDGADDFAALVADGESVAQDGGIGGEAGKGYRGDQRKECSAESELERFDHVRYSGA